MWTWLSVSYSSVAPETTLSAGITNASTSITVGSVTGFPANTPYTLALDYEGAIEELVQVNAAAGTTLTVARGIDGTGAAAHNAGARVRHVSSARDFADSRSHENSANGVHGLSPSEDLVGTEKVQTLSNKTFVNATGSLRNITVNNTGGTPLAIVGDGVNDTDSALTVQPSSILPATVRILNNGQIRTINTTAIDASNTSYRFRAVKSGGADIFAVLSGGAVNTTLSNGAANGFSVLASPDDVTRQAFNSLSNVGALRAAIYTNGTMDLNCSTPSANILDLKMAASQTAAPFRILDNANNLVTSISPAGSMTLTDVTATGQISTASLFVSGSASLPITTASGTAVATAASGFSINSATVAAKVGGMTTVNVVFTRTGADIVGDGPATGTPGNIPDTLAFTITPTWRPNAIFGTERISAVINAGGTCGGTCGLNPATGQVELLTLNTSGVFNNGGIGRVCFTYPSV